MKARFYRTIQNVIFSCWFILIRFSFSFKSSISMVVRSISLYKLFNMLWSIFDLIAPRSNQLYRTILTTLYKYFKFNRCIIIRYSCENYQNHILTTQFWLKRIMELKCLWKKIRYDSNPQPRFYKPTSVSTWPMF